jgi:hypothetical protein
MSEQVMSVTTAPGAVARKQPRRGQLGAARTLGIGR